MDHFMNPRNVGVIENPDGYGKVGNPVCGDLMEIFINVKDDRIDDIKFRTFGCGSAIAVSSMVTEMAKGKILDEAIKITRDDVAGELGGLPPQKLHCSNLGADALRAATGAQVYGPARERMPEPLERLAQGDTVNALGLQFQVIDVPGHTAGHIAYYCADMDGAPLLFCGDTLFSGGCGRLFEGTPAQMLDSLDRLAALPGNTRVCCTHEYTLSNLKFARAVEPGNAALLHYSSQCEALRAQNQPTLPSQMALERDINPFLRVRQSPVAQAAQGYDAQVSLDDAVAVLAALRQWKNEFR